MGFFVFGRVMLSIPLSPRVERHPLPRTEREPRPGSRRSKSKTKVKKYLTKVLLEDIISLGRV